MKKIFFCFCIILSIFAVNPLYAEETLASSETTLQVTDTQVTDWVKRAFTSLSKFNFVDYQTKLNESSVYFTPSAWKRYKPILMHSKRFKLVQDDRLFVTGTIEGEGPKIIKKDRIEGNYRWTVRFPAKISFQGANATVEKNVIVTLEVLDMKIDGNQKLVINDVKILEQ